MHRAPERSPRAQTCCSPCVPITRMVRASSVDALSRFGGINNDAAAGRTEERLPHTRGLHSRANNSLRRNLQRPFTKEDLRVLRRLSSNLLCLDSRSKKTCSLRIDTEVWDSPVRARWPPHDRTPRSGKRAIRRSPRLRPLRHQEMPLT